MAVGVPFGLLMLAFAVIGGETESANISPSAGSAFALGLAWGTVGGLIGAATKLPLDELTREGAEKRADRRSSRRWPRCARSRPCS